VLLLLKKQLTAQALGLHSLAARPKAIAMKNCNRYPTQLKAVFP